jgi:hypothetical protein
LNIRLSSSRCHKTKAAASRSCGVDAVVPWIEEATLLGQPVPPLSRRLVAAAKKMLQNAACRYRPPKLVSNIDPNLAGLGDLTSSSGTSLFSRAGECIPNPGPDLTQTACGISTIDRHGPARTF